MNAIAKPTDHRIVAPGTNTLRPGDSGFFWWMPIWC